MDREEFISKASIVHKGENIDYSNVVYINNRTKVLLIDPVYGKFWQTPSNHLKGHGHPMRRKEKISSSKRMTQEEVVKRFESAHKGEGLDYSKVVYTNMHTKVCIIDPVYGEFWQEPIVHLKGCGHPRRAIEKHAERQKYTTEIFKRLCKEVHPNYILDKVEYKASQDKVCIICPKHGEFWSHPDALLQGKGCPKCGNHLSRGEDEIYEMLCDVIGKENIIKNDRAVLSNSELDIYIPKFSFAIEYDGLRWHSEKFGKDKNYHLKKLIECEKNGIRLVHVFEDEWLEKRDIVFEKILRIIGIGENLTKIDARKTLVKEISKEDAKEFLNKNHIQGYTYSSLHIGCFYCGAIIGVMSFKKYKNEKWELTRFATISNTLCRGCGGKLFHYFVKTYNPLMVKSFADRRWTYDKDFNIYTILGFKLDDVLEPNYRYTNGHGKREHKFGFRKKILHRKYGFPLSMTELEMTKELGYYRIWDCGLYKYIWRRES